MTDSGDVSNPQLGTSPSLSWGWIRNTLSRAVPSRLYRTETSVTSPATERSPTARISVISLVRAEDRRSASDAVPRPISSSASYWGVTPGMARAPAASESAMFSTYRSANALALQTCL